MDFSAGLIGAFRTVSNSKFSEVRSQLAKSFEKRRTPPKNSSDFHRYVPMFLTARVRILALREGQTRREVGAHVQLQDESWRKRKYDLIVA